MQSLSSMLSPLKTSGNLGGASDSVMEGKNMDLQTPLSITIPNDYEIVGETQGTANNQFQNFGTSNQLWPMYNQQPLLTSRSPEMDALTKLNAQIGNQYTYQMFDMEKASNSNYQGGLQNDPRLGYDKIIYTTSNTLPYMDPYYQCAYGQPKPDRMAIRHKLNDNDDDAGPETKRHCVGESRFGNERSVIVQNTNVTGHGSNTQEG